MKLTFKKFFSHIMAAGATPQERALAVALGIAIALSPFLGIQTFIIFGSCWLLHLNPSITFAVAFLVNNPWTMIPIAAADYMIGYFIIEKMLGYNLLAYNPPFMGWVNQKIGYYVMNYLGIPALVFWYYIIGGLILASVVGLISYVIGYYCFTRYERSHENHHPKQKSIS